MPKLIRTLSVSVMSLLILLMAGCVTCTEAEIILPADLDIPFLAGDDNQDIATLVGQDIRWRIRMNYCRYIVGEIDKEEHDEIKAQLEALLVFD